MSEPAIPDSHSVIRVGWVGLGPFSFYGVYIAIMNHPELAYNYLNMRVTHIWGDDYHKNFKGSPEYVKRMIDYWHYGEHTPAYMAEKYNIPHVCKDFHEMVGEVDAVMIMDFDRAYELAEPFILRGLPIFLCSPVAVSVPECERILDLAEKHGSAIYTGSFTTDMHENQTRYSKISRDKIASFFASTSHHFYTSYANDGLEPVYSLIGPGTRSVALQGWDGSNGYDPDGIPLSRIHIEYDPRGDMPPIQGTLNLGGLKKEMEWFRVYYHDHTVLEGVTNWTRPELTHRDFLIRLQDVFATNTSPESREDILTKLKVVIAGYKSANENNRPVRLDEVEDYQLPTVRIEFWDKPPI